MDSFQREESISKPGPIRPKSTIVPSTYITALAMQLDTVIGTTATDQEQRAISSSEEIQTPLRTTPITSTVRVLSPPSPSPPPPPPPSTTTTINTETLVHSNTETLPVQVNLHPAVEFVEILQNARETKEEGLVREVTALSREESSSKNDKDPSNETNAIPRSPRSKKLIEHSVAFKRLPRISFESVKSSSLKQLREFPIQILLPGGETLVLICNIEDTIKTIKDQLKSKAVRSNLKPSSHYVLKAPSVEGYLSDETIAIGNIPLVENCRKQSTTPKLILVEKSAALTKKEKLINVEIGSLLGSPLCWTQEDNEITQFRKSMIWVRYHISNCKDGRTGSMDASNLVFNRSSGTSFLNVVGNSGENSEGSKLMIKLRLPLTESTLEKTVIATERETANQFIEKMFEKYYKQKTGPNKKASDFVLKVSGFAEYISGDRELSSFEYIRNCLSKKQQLHLSLVENENEDNELYVEDFPSEELLDDPQIKYDHSAINAESHPWDQLSCISIWEITRNFKMKIIGVENVKRIDFEKQENPQLFITAGLYHGGELLAPLITTQLVNWNLTPRWYEWISISIQMCNIPRATRVCFTLYLSTSSSKKDESNNVALGWVAFQLFDYKHELRCGIMSLNMWPDSKANPIGTCVGNSNDINAMTLFIEFDTYELPVVFPTEDIRIDSSVDFVESLNYKSTVSTKVNKIVGAENDMINNLINKDPLYPITPSDKIMLWNERNYCKSKASSLPKFLMSVAYNDRISVQIMHNMLVDWAPISTVGALELLDSRFADSKVRAFAVKCLEQLSDDELSDYLLQLVQVLKYEPYHDSALARFLLRRALLNRTIGHSLFWFLKSEIHVQEISERYGLLLEAYLRGCGTHRLELKRQTNFVKELVRIANHIKVVKSEDRKEALHAELRKLTFPNKVQLPLNPMIEVYGLVIEKCKYMDSKKLPLWLIFSNADPNGPAKYVIFKSGDDLRQDMLTLQMIRLMDKLWCSNGLNLELSPYRCIATGNEEGMIEVVLNSETMANITKNAGGATAAFRADPLANWIREHNPSDAQYAKAVENFISSCAGYCVATYVLGIGDRHNDNVMITKEGRLFHIDFGHFLGNFKKKFGIKRERAPFVFTPDFAYVMGGRDSKDFNKFVDLCCRAYNVVRKCANLFINLFAMMLSTGIPELTSVEDIAYLRDAFSLDVSDEKAREKFTNLIYHSLTTKSTQFNNAIHILAH